jgi:hypothetical protein
MKILVKDGQGKLCLEVEKLADLRVEVAGRRFDCVVTRAYQGLPDLTAANGSRICPISYRDMREADSDVKKAALLAFGRLIEKHGADRVAAVLLGAS